MPSCACGQAAAGWRRVGGCWGVHAGRSQARGDGARRAHAASCVAAHSGRRRLRVPRPTKAALPPYLRVAFRRGARRAGGARAWQRQHVCAGGQRGHLCAQLCGILEHSQLHGGGRGAVEAHAHRQPSLVSCGVDDAGRGIIPARQGRAGWREAAHTGRRMETVWRSILSSKRCQEQSGCNQAVVGGRAGDWADEAGALHEQPRAQPLTHQSGSGCRRWSSRCLPAHTATRRTSGRFQWRWCGSGWSCRRR